MIVRCESNLNNKFVDRIDSLSSDLETESIGELQNNAKKYHHYVHQKLKRDSGGNVEILSMNNNHEKAPSSIDYTLQLLKTLHTRDTSNKTTPMTVENALSTLSSDQNVNGKYSHMHYSFFVFIVKLLLLQPGTTSNKIDNDLSKPFINKTSATAPDYIAAAPKSACSTNIDPTNAITVLQRVLDELEIIKSIKQCNSTPDGSVCNIAGSWNSENIGLKIALTTSLENEVLSIKLSEKLPKKESYKIDASWNCSGSFLHSIGGPLVFTCQSKLLETVATFQGICKKCGGYDTIFGQWTFIHQPKDCQELNTFIDNKNDVFRRDSLNMVTNTQHKQGNKHQTLII